MPRRPKPSWNERHGCYVTKAGGTTKYFRGIGRHELARIGAAFEDYLRELDARGRPPEPTADDLCAAFVAAARGVKDRTVESHRERLLVWLEWAPDGGGPILGRRASTLGAADLRKFLRHLEALGRSDHYRAGLCRSVKAAWAWAAGEEGGRLIPSNPMAEVRGPAVGRSPERYAERSEVAAFLRFCWRRTARERAAPGPGGGAMGPERRRVGRLLVLLMRVAAHTGARPGELCAAEWRDFSREKGTITLDPARHKTGGKTKRDRVIYLPPMLARAIGREQGRPDRHPTHPFFHKRGAGRGKDARRDELGPWTPRVLTRRVRELRREAIRAGVPLADAGPNRFVLYRLRHTFISDGLMGGVKGASIGELTGTSERIITQVYGHLLDDHLKATHEAIRAARRPKGGKG